MKTNPALHFLSAFLLGTMAYAGPPLQKEVKQMETPEPESWQVKLMLPAWIATTRGDIGINGNTSFSNTGFNEIANKIDLVGAGRFEISKGRFGILGDFSYFSISDGTGLDGPVKKLDVREDQALGDLGFRWRLIDTPRGSLDLLGGARYTYLHAEVGLQGNDAVIGAAANRLALAGTVLRAQVLNELRELSGRDQDRFGGPSLTTGEIARLARELETIEGNTAERAERIEKKLRKALNRRLSYTKQWIDPYVGLRARYNLSDTFYVTGRADVSPFDVGSDFAWQASAGFGWQITRRVSYEVVYRMIDSEYRHDGFIYDVTAHGPEATLGIQF